MERDRVGADERLLGDLPVGESLTDEFGDAALGFRQDVNASPRPFGGGAPVPALHAEQTFVSANTIAFHLRNIYRKLGITSRVQLARVVLDSSEDYT